MAKGKRGVNASVLVPPGVKELKRSVERLQDLIDEAPIGICHTDLKGKFTYVNKRFEMATGYSWEEVVGKSGFKLGIFSSETLKLLRKRTKDILMGKPPRLLETQFKCKDGHLIWIAMEGKLMREGGIPVGFQIIASDITERKRAEEALQKSNARFRDIAENALEWIWEVDANGKYTYASPVVEKILGYKPEEVLKKHFYDLFHPDDREKLKEAAFEVFAKKQAFRQFINRNVHKNGETVWLVTSGVPVLDGEGNLLGYRGADVDITERKQMEEELKLRAQILDSATDSILLHDFDGNFIYVNEAAWRAHGSSKEELMKMKLPQVIAPERVSGLDSDFQQMLEKGQVVFESAHLRKDGSIMPTEVHGRTIESGGRKLFLAVIRDITERKRAEEALLESEERFRCIVENSYDGIMILDDAHRFIYVNDELCRMSGYSREEIIGQDFRKFLDEESRQLVADRYIRRQRGEEVPPRYEFNIIRKDGQKRRVEISSSVIKDSAGKVKTVAQILDITERKRMEEEIRDKNEQLAAQNQELQAANEELRKTQEQLVRSERLAAIGQLAGGVGHELRNPLGAIKNAVYYIEGKVAGSELGQKEPRVLEFLDIIEDEINSSNKIINDLLGFSRVGKPSVSPTRIERVIDDALLRTSIPESIKLTKKLDADLPEVNVDPDQIKQVLVNIITNAVEAMPEAGRLTIVAKKEGKFVEVEVSDTGCGIPQESMDKIFDPLFTTKAKGIGLGLAVCKAIIERHEGNIAVKSKVGEGTTFNIKLPLRGNTGGN